MRPLGEARDIRAALARFNTGTDGGEPKNTGSEVLYGPGMNVELPTSTPVIQQALVSVYDEDLALPVLMRLCKSLQWKMMDMDSGRVFG